MLVLTQLMNFLLVPHLAHAGLALSIGLGALINASWLYFGLRRCGAYVPAPGWRGFLARVVLSAGLLGALLAFADHRIDWIGLQAHSWQRAGWLALCLAGAGLVYFGSLLALGVKLGQFVRRG